jgi:hypothetical protein
MSLEHALMGFVPGLELRQSVIEKYLEEREYLMITGGYHCV